VGLRLRIQNESDYLTYKPVNNNINVLLRDAQKVDIRARYKSR
jgi:hypothetical protein